MRPGLLNKSSDSTTLSSLLERARGMFHGSPQRSHNGSHVTNSSHVTSDHDSGVQTCPHDLSSGGDVTPPAMLSPIVQSYIAGLQDNQDPGENTLYTQCITHCVLENLHTPAFIITKSVFTVTVVLRLCFILRYIVPLKPRLPYHCLFILSPQSPDSLIIACCCCQ